MPYKYDEVRPLRVRQVGDRSALREEVTKAFLNEKPGRGRENLASRYRYDVEILEDGRLIYLTRPGRFHGLDFVIHVEGFRFTSRSNAPSQSYISQDLREKARQDPQAYRQLHNALIRVFECEDPDDIIEDYRHLRFSSGLTVEALLKIVKWLFIEQDVRYWNYSGRGMFKEVIDQIFTMLPQS